MLFFPSILSIVPLSLVSGTAVLSEMHVPEVKRGERGPFAWKKLASRLLNYSRHGLTVVN